MNTTCKTCKSWSAPDTQEDPQTGFGLCREIGHGEVFEGSIALVSAQDTEDYNAWIRTRPEFGCVLWS